MSARAGVTCTSHRHIMTTWTKYKHFLIDSYRFDDSLDLTSSLPFSGALQLPTKMQALKLFLFIKDEVGRKNGWSSSKGEIEGMVTRVITHYWMMAGYPTVDQTPAQKQVKAIVDQYQTLLKSKSKNQPKAIKLRDLFLADLKTCLHIGRPGLREHLMTDRVRVNLGVATEDVAFLNDQLGPRHQAMSNKVDEEFAKRKAGNLKRKASAVPQPGPSSAKSPSNIEVNEEEETDHEEDDDDNDDEDYVATIRREKRSKMITVRMPKNVFMSPELISALDRCKTSDYSAMRILSKVFTQFELQMERG